MIPTYVPDVAVLLRSDRRSKALAHVVRTRSGFTVDQLVVLEPAQAWVPSKAMPPSSVA